MNNTHRGFAPIVTLVIVLVVLIAGGGAYVAMQPTSPSANTSSNTPADPKAVYLAMRAEFDRAKTFADLLAVSLKFGTKANIDMYNAQKAQVDALPTELKNSVVTQIKSVLPPSSQFTNIAVTTTDTTATLKISTSKPGELGTILMVKENGVWKLEKESWQ